MVLWNARKLQRLQYVSAHALDAGRQFDPFESEWNCELEERIGTKFGDGGKFVCGITSFDETCLVYSVGSGLDDSFERDIRAKTSCEVHTFDPTVNTSLLTTAAQEFRYSVHSVGLAANERKFSQGVVKPLSAIMQMLGHTNRHLTILKVDCEGCEYEAFPSVFDGCATGQLTIDQLQIELHTTNFSNIAAFFEGADRCGLMIFHKERNHWGCAGWRCVEFALISREAAWRSFKKSHCVT